MDEFSYRNKAKGTRTAYCKTCGAEKTREHYWNNKAFYLARNARLESSNLAAIREAKNKPCADCGICYPFYVMDFDHREGTEKSFHVSQMKRWPLKTILLEIAKCDVVCANCHRIRSHNRRIQAKRK